MQVPSPASSSGSTSRRFIPRQMFAQRAGRQQPGCARRGTRGISGHGDHKARAGPDRTPAGATPGLDRGGRQAAPRVSVHELRGGVRRDDLRRAGRGADESSPGVVQRVEHGPGRSHDPRCRRDHGQGLRARRGDGTDRGRQGEVVRGATNAVASRMAFFQQPPRLANQFDDDPMLVSWIARFCPELAGELRELGDVTVEFYAKQLADRRNEPVLTQWDAWGQRVDRIEVSPLWREAQGLAARTGMVAAGYEARLGAHARTHQFAIVHVLGPSLDVYTCPLAMTDGAARTLLASGNQALIERYVPRLISRDPAVMWTSGQWMTERTGGSDVSQSETIARPDGGTPGGWRLYGTKWFTSATTSEMALTLAR